MIIQGAEAAAQLALQGPKSIQGGKQSSVSLSDVFGVSGASTTRRRSCCRTLKTKTTKVPKVPQVSETALPQLASSGPPFSGKAHFSLFCNL